LNIGKCPIIYIAFIIPHSKANEQDKSRLTMNELHATTLLPVAAIFFT